MFLSPINSFTQIPYLDGEVALTDRNNQLFWGEIGTNFSRAKTKSELIVSNLYYIWCYSNKLLKQIVPTDCPRRLLGMSLRDVCEIDLRVQNDPGVLLFDISPEQPYGIPESNSFASRDEFCHLNLVESGLDAMILTTGRRHYLLDRRMPNKEILLMGHAEIDGGDYLIMVDFC